MASIFVSCTHTDKDLGERLAAALRARAHQVFCSGQTLTPASEWHSVIENQLSGSDVTLVLVAQGSCTSEWVIAESNAALAYVAERGKGAVVPIVFDNAPLPQTLREVQAIVGERDKLEDVAEQADGAIDAILARQLGA